MSLCQTHRASAAARTQFQAAERAKTSRRADLLASCQRSPGRRRHKHPTSYPTLLDDDVVLKRSAILWWKVDQVLDDTDLAAIGTWEVSSQRRRTLAHWVLSTPFWLVDDSRQTDDATIETTLWPLLPCRSHSRPTSRWSFKVPVVSHSTTRDLLRRRQDTN